MNGADNLDRASDLTMARTKASVDRAHDLAKPEQVQNADGSWPHPDCVDCGVENLRRAALAKVRCISCQERRERQTWQR